MWQIAESSKFTVGKVDIQMENSFLNELVYLSKDIINAIIIDCMPLISKSIDKRIDTFNTMLILETPYTFVTNALNINLPLNLTMSQAPTVVDDFATFNMDGRFVAPMGKPAVPTEE